MKIFFQSSILIVFLASMLNGVVQFASQSFLNALLDPQLFSQITFVFAQFAPCLLLIELGLQGELVRRFSHLSPNLVSSVSLPALVIRLWGAMVAFVGLLAHGLVAKVSWSTMQALFVFGLCFFPAAVLVTAEGLGMAMRRIFLATSLRIARTVSLMVYVPAIYFFPHYALELFIVFLIVFSIFAVCVWSTGPFKFQPGFHWRELIFNTRTSVKEMKVFVLFFVLGWVFSTIFSIVAVRELGDKNLSELNTAQILSIPIALFVQVVMQSWIEVSSRKNSGLLVFSAPHFTLLVVGTVFYQVVMIQTELMSVFFPKTDASHVTLFFIPIGLAQCVIGLNGFCLMAAKINGSGKSGIYASIFGMGVMIAMWSSLRPIYGALSLGFVHLASYLGMFAVLYSAARSRRSISPNS